MASKEFTVGRMKYTPSGVVRLNGIQGRIWTIRGLCADGSGWMHMGKAFHPARSTRKQIAEGGAA